MKRKLVRLPLFLILIIIWFTPGLVLAQDSTTDAFMNYTNPHDICDYYRSQGIRVERETDNECMTSLGEGRYTVYTQYYYSGGEWCYELTQDGQTQYSGCVPIPGSSNEFSEFFSNFHIDSENAPYIIAGSGVLIFVGIVSLTSARSAKTKALRASQQTTTETEEVTEKEKSFNPKVKRSGRGAYGWEEMETSTTEEINAPSPNGPPVDQSHGGVGLHQGEPVVHSTANELEKLVRLKDKGVLTQEEFNLAKQKLLK